MMQSRCICFIFYIRQTIFQKEKDDKSHYLMKGPTDMINILIVEDEKPISNLLKLGLSKSGYHCTCVYDGLAVAERLEKEITLDKSGVYICF